MFVCYVGAVCIQHNMMTVEKWVWEIVLHDGASLLVNMQSQKRPKTENICMVTDRPYDKKASHQLSFCCQSFSCSITCTSTTGSVAIAGSIMASSSQISAPTYVSIRNEHGIKNGIKFMFQSDCKGPHHAWIWHTTCFGAL